MDDDFIPVCGSESGCCVCQHCCSTSHRSPALAVSCCTSTTVLPPYVLYCTYICVQNCHQVHCQELPLPCYTVHCTTNHHSGCISTKLVLCSQTVTHWWCTGHYTGHCTGSEHETSHANTDHLPSSVRMGTWTVCVTPLKVAYHITTIIGVWYKL